jgi:hypothetical protein
MKLKCVQFTLDCPIIYAYRLCSATWYGVGYSLVNVFDGAHLTVYISGFRSVWGPTSSRGGGIWFESYTVKLN